MTIKIAFFQRWSWFKFNNFGLALGMNLKFYTSVEKRLKLKVTKFWRLVPTFLEVTGEKLVGGAFLPPPPSWIGLKAASTVNLIRTVFSRRPDYVEFFREISNRCRTQWQPRDMIPWALPHPAKTRPPSL